MPNFNVNGNGKNHNKTTIPKKLVGHIKTNKNHITPNSEIIIRTDCCLGLIMSVNPMGCDNIFSAVPEWQKKNIDFVINDKEIIIRLEADGTLLQKKQVAPHLLEDAQIRDIVSRTLPTNVI